MQLAVAEKSRGNKKYINCIRHLMEALPYENESSIIKEAKLNTRYILPICQSLFDNFCDNASVCFNLVNENNYESEVSQLEISSRRPDGNITVTTDNDARTIGFFEAKSMAESKNHKLINIDLIRLGIFSKNSIDMHNLKSVLAVQAVGSYLTFYLVRKMSGDMNIMIELDHVRFPMSINELPTIFGFSDIILDILHILENECENLENNTAIVATTRKTIRSPLMRSLVVKSTDRKRKNPNKNYYE
ncbi:MAG: hypothetical protein EXX96DRAFT_491512 [Benjaminiella poitrasii]|nr:MAG: hypothetical protein EXX96DRAFT_491512 [Benjaminiella poitrasii]